MHQHDQDRLYSHRIPIIKIKRPWVRLIFMMEIPILVRRCLSWFTSRMIGCQPDEPLVSLMATTRIINVYGFLVVIMLLMFSVIHFLYSVGKKILLLLLQLLQQLLLLLLLLLLIIIIILLPCEIRNLSSGVALMVSGVHQKHALGMQCKITYLLRKQEVTTTL